MVSTRSHPREFTEPTSSPSKRSTPAPTSASSTSSSSTTSSHTPKRSAMSSTSGAWSHTPSNLILIWLGASLPLVMWDFSYVFLRPHSMPGGKLQWPLWVPYELYGAVDYNYGWPAWHANNGFTAAQSALNVVETIGYLVYLWIVYTYGVASTAQGSGAPDKGVFGKLAEARTVQGRWAAWAVLIAYGSALMTLSKTVLYWLNEAFSGFDNIKHNDAISLFFYWIVPNGAWLILPAYMTYVFGGEILEGLATATPNGKKDQ